MAGKEKTAAELVEAFTELGPAWTRWVHASLPESAVSFARLRALTALECVDEMTMSELSAALEVTPRRVTALVDALEAEGLVERYRHPTDGRSVLVVITDNGLEQQRIGWGRHQEQVATAFADLAAPDQRELLRISRELTEIFRRHIADRDLPPTPAPKRGARIPRHTPGDSGTPPS